MNNIIWKPNKKDTFLGPGDGIGIFIGKLKKNYIWGPGVGIGILLEKVTKIEYFKPRSWNKNITCKSNKNWIF